MLVVFTTKRLLLYSLDWNTVRRIEQYSYESIREVREPTRGFFDARPQLRVDLMVEGMQRTLVLTYFQKEYLQLLGKEFSRHIGRSSGERHAVLCLTCLQPMRGDYCLHCASKLMPDWKPVWLSVLFPGLGQLKNGEMVKGLVYVVVATMLLLIGTISIRGWFFEGADLSVFDKAHVLYYVGITAPALYIANIVDAYRSSVRARKQRR